MTITSTAPATITSTTAPPAAATSTSPDQAPPSARPLGQGTAHPNSQQSAHGLGPSNGMASGPRVGPGNGVSNGQRQRPAHATAAASSQTDRGPSRSGARPGVLQLLRDAQATEHQPANPAPITPADSPVSNCTDVVPAAERSAATASPAAAGFSIEQLAALAAPLDRALISSREQGRGRVHYLQSWVVINEANRIFGFDGWQRQTLFSHCVTQAERTIGRDHKPGWGVTYIARVRISVHAGCRGLLIREGTGAGHGIDGDLGLAHESAIKEAETDAMKRALMTFGNPFGLALYDKSQRQVSAPDTTGAAAGQGRGPAASHGMVRRANPGATTPIARAFNGAARNTTAPAISQASEGPGADVSQASAATADSGHAPAAAPGRPAPDAPLDPPTIRSLQERIRALLPPQLAAFSRAFRSAFQVPESTPSIAGLITEQRHRLWIQHYLGQALGQGVGRDQARTA